MISFEKSSPKGNLKDEVNQTSRYRMTDKNLNPDLSFLVLKITKKMKRVSCGFKLKQLKGDGQISSSHLLKA